MNRGLTVKGLTITYMPRNRGVGNADTIEQRARWFGYKAGYPGYCRVYLSNDSQIAYRSYVTHEENIRKQLNEHSAKGRGLSEWRRAFFLSADLRPTRSDVLDLDYVRGNFSKSWFWQTAPHYLDEAITFNQSLVNQVRERFSFVEDSGHPKRTDDQKHLVINNIELRQVFDEFLSNFRVASPKDSQRFTGLLLQLAAYLENNPKEHCSIYILNKGKTRDRSVNANNEIPSLFQGEYPDEAMGQVKKGEIYPGDRNIRAKKGLTIQLHLLRITRGTGKDREILAPEAPTLAIYVPQEMSAPWIVQDQGGT